MLQRRRQADGELRSTTGELKEGGSVGPAEKKCSASGIENRNPGSLGRSVGLMFLQVDASPHGLRQHFVVVFLPFVAATILDPTVGAVVLCI